MPQRGRGRPPHPDVLTPAEWRVLEEVRTGATNAEIAVRLGLGITTVKFHLRNMRGKLELDDRSDLAAWRREAEPRTATRRWLLAPLGLLAGFWKPVVGGTALVVVGGSAIAAGVLAYAIANDGAAASLPDQALASAPEATPVDGPSPVPTATPMPTPTPPPPPPPIPSPTPDAPVNAGPFREVQGAILGPDGTPIEGWNIRVEAFPPYALREWGRRTDSVETDDDGTFTLRLADGAHVLMVTSQCGEGWVELGWHGPDATFVRDYLEAVPVFVGEIATGEVVLRLPGPPSSLVLGLCEEQG